MSEVRALGVMVEPPVRTESAGDHRVHRGRLCPCQEHDDCGRQGLGCDGIRGSLGMDAAIGVVSCLLPLFWSTPHKS
jgi:hypothetical protein